MVEFIGFIISLLALLYLFLKQNRSSPRQTRTSSEHTVEVKEEENDFFQEFMKTIEKETSSREAIQHIPPPVPPKAKKVSHVTPSSRSLKEYQLESKGESRPLKSSLEERHLKSKVSYHDELPRRSTTLVKVHPLGDEKEKSRPSRVQLAIQRLNKRQDILIYQEVMSRPIALRTGTESVYP